MSGTASGPESERFRAGTEVAAGLAQSVGGGACKALHGNRVQGVEPAEQDALAPENRVLAACAADRVGLPFTGAGPTAPVSVGPAVRTMCPTPGAVAAR
ncbi:hypothetical protein GCM10010269_04450 [Streptomyces humidus]|uniref:Uncharacterized protein n=1 Tax=Streptomyces humidus TaxID=52259 RepID=A0A918FQY4_9ACTN|nr:hypothetical protein GCM10010269_04450 [Streptomyces humidus]